MDIEGIGNIHSSSIYNNLIRDLDIMRNDNTIFLVICGNLILMLMLMALAMLMLMSLAMVILMLMKMIGVTVIHPATPGNTNDNNNIYDNDDGIPFIL